MLAVESDAIFFSWLYLVRWPDLVGEEHDGRLLLLFLGPLFYRAVVAMVIVPVVGSICWVTFLEGPGGVAEF